MSRRIFLSYAREDAAVVAEMVADLRALEHGVWLDQDLGGGQDWWEEILARIRWCDAFVPVLSEAALRSRACASERVYAVALNRPVLPVAVAAFGPEGLLDDDLARRQRIAYQLGDKPATVRLLAAVQRLSPAAPLPEAEPVPPAAPMAYLGALRTELDGATHIDFDRQLTLLGRLSVEAEDPDRHPEVAALVRAFLARPDIASSVERQLTVIQVGLGRPDTAEAQDPPREPAPRRTPPPREFSPARVLRNDKDCLELGIRTEFDPITKRLTVARKGTDAYFGGRILEASPPGDRPGADRRWEDDASGITVTRTRSGHIEVRIDGIVVFG